MADLFNDIERYRKGDMTSAEMHALEKKALTDPFLADALEGTEMLSEEELSNDIQILQQSLINRVTPSQKIISIWGWSARIAAGLAFIAVTAFILVKVLDEAENGANNLALNNETPIAPSIKDSITVKKAEPFTKEKFTEEEISSDKTKPAVSPQTKKVPLILSDHEPVSQQRINADIAESNLPEQSVDEVTVMDREDAERRIESEATQEVPAVNKRRLLSTPSAADKKKETKSFISTVVKGQVVDAGDGKGLPGVNVTIRGTNTGTVTDEEGKYEIAMNDLKAGLLFSFIGFESHEVIPGSNNVNITLEPDIAQLSEVVVVGYGETNKAETLENFPTVEMAEPVGGRKAFKQYLENNLRYPEQALNHKVEGKVTVQFTVESTGQVSDFKILKGIGFGCDEEVIRLIKSGPRWSATKKNEEPIRDRVKVRLKFSLPKK